MKVGKRVGRKEDEGRGRKEKEGRKRKASESMHALTRTCIHSYFLHWYINKLNSSCLHGATCTHPLMCNSSHE